MKLSSSAEAGYSPFEKDLFEMLSTKEHVSTVELAQRKYGSSQPIHAMSTIRSIMRGLSIKVERNKEGFLIRKSERRGPHPVEYWIEPIAKKQRSKR